jgi:DNA-directed RNA polymerase subunit RPC12/RpoP
MAATKFACPHCQQHIEAPDGYGGMQITCPACDGGILVPGSLAPLPNPVINVPPPPSPGVACPSCGGALPKGAVLCTACGYNLVTRQRTVAGRPAAAARPRRSPGDVPWYKTVYPYLGFILVVLGTFYFLGRTNSEMMLVYAGLSALFAFVAHILVVVSAFRNDGMAWGFLSLCIPLVALYYIIKVSDDETLKLVYGVAVVNNLAAGFLAK